MTLTDTALAFMSRWPDPARFLPSISEYFADDCLYENIGLSKTRGPTEAIAFFEAFMKQVPLVAIKVDLLAIAEAGDAVLTERVDHFVAADGSTLMSIPLMGIMKFRDGKLYEWRDYFDTKPFRP